VSRSPTCLCLHTINPIVLPCAPTRRRQGPAHRPVSLNRHVHDTQRTIQLDVCLRFDVQQAAAARCWLLLSPMYYMASTAGNCCLMLIWGGWHAAGVSPLVAGGRPLVAGGRPLVAGGRPLVAGGRPLVAGGRPLVAGGRPLVAGGRPLYVCGVLSSTGSRGACWPLAELCTGVGLLARSWGLAVLPLPRTACPPHYVFPYFRFLHAQMLAM
jgi:hypothetical protein